MLTSLSKILFDFSLNLSINLQISFMITLFVLIDESGGRSDGGIAVFKREYAGTDVFLPRRYCNALPELKKKPACSPAQLPAGVAQSFTKNMDPIIAQARPNIHHGFAPQYDNIYNFGELLAHPINEIMEVTADKFNHAYNLVES
ncbi:hypothetical protein L1887_03025 [Cichorium endivia]|nr:hypothetical protein L1887_03025 [Cichorium endivia]